MPCPARLTCQRANDGNGGPLLIGTCPRAAHGHAGEDISTPPPRPEATACRVVQVAESASHKGSTDKWLPAVNLHIPRAVDSTGPMRPPGITHHQLTVALPPTVTKNLVHARHIVLEPLQRNNSDNNQSTMAPADRSVHRGSADPPAPAQAPPRRPHHQLPWLRPHLLQCATG